MIIIIKLNAIAAIAIFTMMDVKPLELDAASLVDINRVKFKLVFKS